MTHSLLSEEYLMLAKRFREHEALVDSGACALSAIRVNPACEEARVILRTVAEQLADLPTDGPAPDAYGLNGSEKLSRLRKRKVKLDCSLDAQLNSLGISPDMLSPTSRPAHEDALTPEMELDRRFTRLEKRLEAYRGAKCEEIKQRLQDLARALDVGEGSAESDESSDESEFDESLSLEHEIHNLGNDFYKIHLFDDAIKCYTLALELRPDLLESYFNRGLAHTRKKCFGKALQDLTKVIELNPNLAEAYYTRGLVHEYEEDYDKAIADHEKALEVDPTYEKAAAQRELVVSKKRRAESPGSTSSDSSDSEEGLILDFSMYMVKPDCSFADIGGNMEAKRHLQKIVSYLKGNPILAEWGAEIPRGVMLFGPPGVGKTLLARALAGEIKCPFYAPPPGIFDDKWAGNTEKNIRRLWEQASAHDTAVIFVDEFDGFGLRRSDIRQPRGDDWYNRVVSTILGLMDGLKDQKGRLVIIAATNCLHNIDPAFLRPGRFNYTIEVSLPNAAEAAEIWLIQLEGAEERASRVDFITRELRDAVREDRKEWLENAFSPGAEDPSGIVLLARASAERNLSGDDIREVIRRTIDDRVMAALENPDQSAAPISAKDLYTQLVGYKQSDDMV